MGGPGGMEGMGRQAGLENSRLIFGFGKSLVLEAFCRRRYSIPREVAKIADFDWSASCKQIKALHAWNLALEICTNGQLSSVVILRPELSLGLQHVTARVHALFGANAHLEQPFSSAL
jgi:hypothetical protein